MKLVLSGEINIKTQKEFYILKIYECFGAKECYALREFNREILD